MDVSQGLPESTSPPRRSSIPIPKRKSSLHLYIANSFGNGANSQSPSPSSASSVHGGEDPNSASSSRSATAMGMHSSMYVPGRTATANLNVNSEVPPPVSSSDYLQLRENHNRLINKCEEVTRRNQNLESTNQLLKKSVTALQNDVAALRKERSEFVDKNRKLKKKLAEIVPSGAVSSCSDDDEGAEKSLEGTSKDDSVDSRDVTSKSKESELDSLLNEMEKLKSYLNNVELQLYEANEKISELQESKQQYEETSEKLRAENAELSKIARLMSANILESIDTSKRLETSYIQVRRERDNLARQNRDSVDSRTDPNEEIQKMRSEMELKRKTFEAQFIEYKQLMEQQNLRQTDERVVTLQLEVDRLRQDLTEALDRAERAEEEARELRTLLRASQLHQHQQFYSQLDLDKLSLHDATGDNDSLTSGISNSASAAAGPPPPPLPPPPPPPPPPPMMVVPGTTGTGPGLSEAISTQKLNHVGINAVNNKHQATGLDSVIADIKSGRVTLRRRKPNVLNELENAAASGSSSKKSPSGSSRQSHQPPNYSQLAAKNPALKEMYEILERMKRRNRQSKVIVESEIVGGGGGGGGGSDVTDGRTVRTVITGIVDL